MLENVTAMGLAGTATVTSLEVEGEFYIHFAAEIFLLPILRHMGSF